jgi:hypothetical protein
VTDPHADAFWENVELRTRYGRNGRRLIESPLHVVELPSRWQPSTGQSFNNLSFRTN